MTESPDLAITDGVKQLNLLPNAAAFKKLCRVGTELSEHRKFNVFRFADKTISENAWSRIFAWLLDSEEDHELGVRSLEIWLRDGLEDQLRIKDFRSDVGAVLTTTQFPTAAGRYIDILIRIFDKRSHTIAVIGVENKVWSGEQATQVGDYQSDLDERFSCPKLVVFLTPEGRTSTTANDDLKTCPCVPKSYSTIIDLCDALSHIGECNPNLVNLLKQMKSYLGTEIATTRDAKGLVRRLYADKKYRAGLHLISQFKPNTFDVFSELKEQVENALRKRKPYLEHWWWPTRGGKPYDVRLVPTKLETLTLRGRAPFAVNYILICDKDEPDIGDAFKLIVAAWCKNKAAVHGAKRFVLPHEPEIWREHSRWYWVTLWPGNEYRLKDLGSADAKGLSMLVIDAIDQTYKDFLRKAERMRI